jgi:patatin-like phospholipase/acyl hydrolase
MMMSYRDKLNKIGPRKLLALDGGGIRGVITLEVLAEIERQLQKKLGRGDDFVLADYFDYIAGTSTGAIIGTCLALGMRVEQVARFYEESGPAMFDKANLIQRFKQGKFHDKKLAIRLQELIEQRTGNPMSSLGSEHLRTLLMVVLRNVTTDSPWPVSNNPAAKYNAPDRKNNNLNIPLWQLIRGSTAAPTYFPPEVVKVGDDEFIFEDGGVTMHNNPAFQLFLMATVEAYNLAWPTGEKEMLLVSIGTGTDPKANANLTPGQMNLIYNATSIPAALMFAASNEQDFLCRVFGKCLVGDPLDREVHNMIDERDLEKDFPGCKGPCDKLFTYLRYNAELSKTGLERLGVGHLDPKHVQQMDSVDYIGEMQELGQALAQQKVKSEHFAGFPAAS